MQYTTSNRQRHRHARYQHARLQQALRRDVFGLLARGTDRPTSNAQARIPAATGAAWHHAAHARLTSDAEPSFHPELDPRQGMRQNLNKKTNPGRILGFRPEVTGPGPVAVGRKMGGPPAGGAEFGDTARG